MSVRKTLLDGVVYVGRYKRQQKPHEPVQLAVLRQYKDLLRQTKFLFDENARIYVAARIRQRFRDNILIQGLQRLKKVVKEGRRWLSILERANLGDIKAISDVLNHTYARVGRRRHEILENLTMDKTLGPRLDRWRSFLTKEKNIDPAKMAANIEKYSNNHRLSRPRGPPEIPPAVQELMKKDPNVDHAFKLPSRSPYQSQSVPLKRKVNAAWKHYKLAREKLSVPLPREEIQFLIRMALHGPDEPFVRTEFLQKIEARRKGERIATGRFRGRFHQMDHSFIQRRYQQFLMRHYIPILEQVQRGEWRVTDTKQLLPPTFRVIPDIDPRHMRGFVVKGSRTVGEVDAKGQLVNW